MEVELEKLGSPGSNLYVYGLVPKCPFFVRADSRVDGDRM